MLLPGLPRHHGLCSMLMLPSQYLWVWSEEGTWQWKVREVCVITELAHLVKQIRRKKALHMAFPCSLCGPDQTLTHCLQPFHQGDEVQRCLQEKGLTFLVEFCSFWGMAGGQRGSGYVLLWKPGEISLGALIQRTQVCELHHSSAPNPQPSGAAEVPHLVHWEKQSRRAGITPAPMSVRWRAVWARQPLHCEQNSTLPALQWALQWARRCLPDLGSTVL